MNKAYTAENNDNKKYVSPDGRQELIFDVNDILVTAPEDIGTYNFIPSTKNKVGHFIMDVLPWILYGNTPDDTTTPKERLGAFLGLN